MRIYKPKISGILYDLGEKPGSGYLLPGFGTGKRDNKLIIWNRVGNLGYPVMVTNY